jgi:hypothetical protein
VGPSGPQGPEGKTGPQGPSGTTGFTKTLPSGETETGVWSFLVKPEDKGQFISVPLSFPIPLAANESVTKEPIISEEKVHFFAKGEVATKGNGCGEGSAAKPEAEPGNLCIYTGVEEIPSFKAEQILITDPALSGRVTGAGATGAVMGLFVPGSLEETGNAEGTWAVSAQ